MKAFPLSWPDGWPRTMDADRKAGHFSKHERQYSTQPGGGSWIRHREITVADATARLTTELQRFADPNVDWIISTNIPLRMDGLPRSNTAAPADPGAAVYWQRPGETDMQVMAIDVYLRVADNLAAIAATLEAMRTIERHGGAQVLNRAFKGFLALPEPGALNGRSWRDVIGVDADESSLIVVRAEFRKKAIHAHPDNGGSHEQMVTLNLAMQQAEEALSR